MSGSEAESWESDLREGSDHQMVMGDGMEIDLRFWVGANQILTNFVQSFIHS